MSTPLAPTSKALEVSLSNWSAMFSCASMSGMLNALSMVAALPWLLKPPDLKPMPQLAKKVHSSEGTQARLILGCTCE